MTPNTAQASAILAAAYVSAITADTKRLYGIDCGDDVTRIVRDLKRALAALGYPVVPMAVTEAPGFDGRCKSGGRFDEASSAQDDAS